MNADWIGMHFTKIANAAATINAGIAIQALAIASGDGYADAIVVADDWSHITDCDQQFRAVVAAAEEGYHALFVVATVYPSKAFRTAI